MARGRELEKHLGALAGAVEALSGRPGAITLPRRGSTRRRSPTPTDPPSSATAASGPVAFEAPAAAAAAAAPLVPAALTGAVLAGSYRARSQVYDHAVDVSTSASSAPPLSSSAVAMDVAQVGGTALGVTRRVRAVVAAAAAIDASGADADVRRYTAVVPPPPTPPLASYLSASGESRAAQTAPGSVPTWSVSQDAGSLPAAAGHPVAAEEKDTGSLLRSAYRTVVAADASSAPSRLSLLSAPGLGQASSSAVAGKPSTSPAPAATSASGSAFSAPLAGSVPSGASLAALIAKRLSTGGTAK